MEETRRADLDILYKTAETAPWMENDADTNKRQEILWDIAEFGDLDDISDLPESTRDVIQKDAITAGYNLSDEKDLDEVLTILNRHAELI